MRLVGGCSITARPRMGGVISKNLLSLERAGKFTKGGCAISKGPEGSIITDRKFNNYEFSFEWKISEAGNSGVKYLSPSKETARLAMNTRF